MCSYKCTYNFIFLKAQNVGVSHPWNQSEDIEKLLLLKNSLIIMNHFGQNLFREKNSDVIKAGATKEKSSDCSAVIKAGARSIAPIKFEKRSSFAFVNLRQFVPYIIMAAINITISLDTLRK